MLKSFFEKSVAERTSYYSDERALCLHAVFIGSMQESIMIAEKVYNDFLLSLKPVGMFESGTDNMRSVKIDSLFEIFQNEFKTWDESHFISDFFLKTTRIKTKKDLKGMEKRLLGIGSNRSYEERVLLDRLKRGEIYSNQFKGQDRDNALIKKLLHCTEYAPIFYGGCSDANLGFYAKKYGTAEDIYKADLSLRIRMYSLGKNLNDAAEYLKSWLEQVGSQYSCVSGYVGKGSLSGQFDSPQMMYFDDYEDGIVRESDGHEYEVRPWMETNFAEGIEWVNVFSDKVSNKITYIEELKKLSNVELKELTHGNIAVCSTKEMDAFCAEDAEILYPYLSKCLRPGSSTIEITNLRFNIHDLPIPESTYRIHGEYVTFSRGNFDFVTTPLSEIDFGFIEKNGGTNYRKICEMLESNFEAKCIFFQEAVLSAADVEQMMLETKKKAMFPMLFCAGAPIMDHLQELSQKGMKFDKHEYNETLYANIAFEEDVLDKALIKKKFTELPLLLRGKANNHFREYLSKSADKNLSMIWMETPINPLDVLDSLGFDACMQAPFFQLSRRWFEKYGAIPTVIGFNAIEYQLEKPVPKSEAIDVAMEHFQYTSGFFHAMGEIENTIISYAADLAKSKVWHLGFF